MSAPPLNHDRLIAIINMLASDNDNEMLVAARKLRDMAKQRGQLVVEFLRVNLGAPAARQQSNPWADRYRESEREQAAREQARERQRREEDIMRRSEAAAREAREKAARDKRQAEEAARARAEQAKATPWDDGDWGVADEAAEDWPHPGLDTRERRIVKRMLERCRLGTWARGFLESVRDQKYTLTLKQQAKLDELIDEHNAGSW